MFSPEKLFRKAAMEKLSSPEQLDVIMHVTSPMGWLALIGLACILVLAVVWSILGSIAIKVEGQGILIRGSQVLDVSSGSEGRLNAVLVKAGQNVEKGQVVARISLPELALRIENTKEQLKMLSKQNVEIGARGNSIFAQYQSQIAGLREKVATQQQLVAKGLLTRSTLLRTKEELANIEQLIAQNRMTQSGQANRVEDLKRELKEYESKLAGSADIHSPYAGRVLEVMADPGNVVGAGSRILTLEPMDAPIESVVYIPAAEGKKVHPGMQVRISPSTVKAEEYGFIIGQVKSVSNFPVTPEGLRRVLRNEKLIETLMGKSAPIEVVAGLTPDKSTPSGYKWSSSSGPPNQIYSGTLCSASVVVENRRPVSYVLPIFKKALGVI